MPEQEPFSDEQCAILDLLAEMIIPEDDFDSGLKGVGFSSIMEMRNMYQPWIGGLYTQGLGYIQAKSLELHNKKFIELGEEQQETILNMLEEVENSKGIHIDDAYPSDFYTTLRNDACFVYCTDEEVWERIGFPGPSFNNGGYPDYANTQE